MAELLSNPEKYCNRYYKAVNIISDTGYKHNIHYKIQTIYARSKFIVEEVQFLDCLYTINNGHFQPSKKPFCS